MYKINIVLHEPEIPQNTGNIARTCAATGASLHIIRPMGFEIDDRKLKRAGLDYWDKLDITYYENYEDFLQKRPQAKTNTYYFSTKAPQSYTEVDYPDDIYIMFGKETKGMPSSYLILCLPLLLLPSIFPSIRVFSSESVLRIRRSKNWEFQLQSFQ